MYENEHDTYKKGEDGEAVGSGRVRLHTRKENRLDVKNNPACFLL